MQTNRSGTKSPSFANPRIGRSTMLSWSSPNTGVISRHFCSHVLGLQRLHWQQLVRLHQKAPLKVKVQKARVEKVPLRDLAGCRRFGKVQCEKSCACAIRPASAPTKIAVSHMHVAILRHPALGGVTALFPTWEDSTLIHGCR